MRTLLALGSSIIFIMDDTFSVIPDTKIELVFQEFILSKEITTSQI